MSIKIYYDQTRYRVKGWRKISKLLKEVIGKEKKISGDLSFVITDDENLREINRKFLEHDYNTDVITFNYNSGNVVNGEIYISMETVRVNALNYKVSLKTEMDRVIIHGVLHLVGYDDKTSVKASKMRKMEDFWLTELEEDK